MKAEYVGKKGEDGSLIVSLKDYVKPYQADPDLCWAACLEQALAAHGVQIDQEAIAERVYKGGKPSEDRTIDSWTWHQELSIDRYKLADGKEVWCRCDVDRTALTRDTVARKLKWELDRGRIPLVALKEAGGGGHVLTVVGAVWPAGTTEPTPANLSGFQLYDPRSTRTAIRSASQVAEAQSFMVYVTCYNSGPDAATGTMDSALNH